jgi:hypothetical protein
MEDHLPQLTWSPKAFNGRSQRYLWSDAFGVCNYLSLYYASDKQDTRYLQQADSLIQNVHDCLGRERHTPYNRLGNSTDMHPLLGGLRIGKEEESDDGQYFHYLTKWMFALNRMSVASKNPKYNDWAIELARVAHAHFVIHSVTGSPIRMVWKMSVDLNRILVPSEGNLDPYDGFVMYHLLQHQSTNKKALEKEIEEMQQLIERKMDAFSTYDELDAGEALWLSSWFPKEKWAIRLRHVALQSIERMFNVGKFSSPSGHRLMFREMGTAIGVQLTTRQSPDWPKWKKRIDELMNFWSNKLYQRDRDISPLMYGSALYPGSWDPSFAPP